MRQLYINGSVATVDSKMSYVQAFAVEDGKFIKTGTNEEILALKTEDATVVDLDGKTVMPGFNDAHHTFLTGLLTMEKTVPRST